MKQCMYISFIAKPSKGFLETFIQKHARKLALEGTVRFIAPDKITIAVCGKKDNLQIFLDFLHEGTSVVKPQEITVEPFLKERDYRGVFRVIE